MTIDQALNVLAERTYENKRDLDRKNLQRRNDVVDIYGERQYVNSVDDAFFYVSLSKDMVYLERFQFKLVFEGLTIPLDVEASGITTDVDLTTNGSIITPNPHNHAVIYNMGKVTTAALPQNFSVTGVYISNKSGNYVDVTAAMDLQYGSSLWRTIEENKVYPGEDLDNSFDVIQMACDLGEDEIISSGLRKIRVTTSGPCNITLLNYLKYSHLNR